MERVLATAFAGIVLSLLLAAPASAQCTFALDRSQTTAGGVFYGIGDPFMPGERVTIKWMPSDIVLDEFVVTEMRDGSGYFNRRLVAPASAEPGPYIVVADVQPRYGKSYRLGRPIEVVAPSTAPPPGAERSEPPPPAAPPTKAHQPVRPMVKAPQPATAPEPVPVAQPAVATAAAPAAMPVPQAATVAEPSAAGEAVRIPAGVGPPVPRVSPEAAPSRSTGTLAPVLVAAAGPGALTALTVAFAASLSLVRRRRVALAV